MQAIEAGAVANALELARRRDPIDRLHVFIRGPPAHPGPLHTIGAEKEPITPLPILVREYLVNGAARSQIAGVQYRAAVFHQYAVLAPGRRPGSPLGRRGILIFSCRSWTRPSAVTQ